jgi:hypothetical protein
MGGCVQVEYGDAVCGEPLLRRLAGCDGGIEGVLDFCQFIDKAIGR